MKTLLIVFHGLSGGTLQMAEAAASAARAQEGVAVRLLRAQEAGPDDVLAADGNLFATSENLAAIAGLMKDFFDRCYYPVLERVNGHDPYAYLKDVLQRLPTHKNSQISERLPHRWTPAN